MQANMQDQGGLGGCSPRKFLEIGCSEIASGTIFGPTISSNIWLSYMHLLSQLTSNFTREGTKVDRTVGGMTSIKGQLVNYRAPDIAIFYVCIYM